VKSVEFGHWSLDGFIPDGEVAVFASREFEVLGLLCEGKTNREIAEDMGIGEQTIKNYVATLLRDLDCNNRARVIIKVTQGMVKVAKSPYTRNHYVRAV
jgi:DNA-binding NarL/FixJ family response regulator